MEYIKKKLNVNFKDNYIIGTVKKMIKNQEKSLYYFYFENRSEPIFAYKIFEELGLIAYFTEDKNFWVTDSLRVLKIQHERYLFFELMSDY